MSADAAHPPHTHLTPDTIRFCPLCGAGLVRQPVGPDKRPEMVCPGCNFIYYVNQKVVAGTIPWQDGRLLLTRRAITPALGKWTFPGGYVDWGETVDAGALRETWEETGLTVELGELVGVYSYAGAPVVIVVYEAAVTGGTLTALPRERSPRVGDAGGGAVGRAGLSVHGGGGARFPGAPDRPRLTGSGSRQRATHVTSVSRSLVRGRALRGR